MAELRVCFSVDTPLCLPLGNQYWLQGMLYNVLANADPFLANQLHAQKPLLNGRHYSPFVFSRLYGSRTVTDRQARYSGKLSLHIRSISPYYLNAWKDGFACGKLVTLMRQPLHVVSAEIVPTPDVRLPVVIRMQSPLVLHKTGEDGKAVYLRPDDDDFTLYAAANLSRKWEAFHGTALPTPLALESMANPEKDRCYTLYKNAHILGWYGTYKVDTSPEVYDFLYHIGLGERNGQGFGFFTQAYESHHPGQSDAQ